MLMFEYARKSINMCLTINWKPQARHILGHLYSLGDSGRLCRLCVANGDDRCIRITSNCIGEHTGKGLRATFYFISSSFGPEDLQVSYHFLLRMSRFIVIHIVISCFVVTWTIIYDLSINAFFTAWSAISFFWYKNVLVSSIINYFLNSHLYIVNL